MTKRWANFVAGFATAVSLGGTWAVWFIGDPRQLPSDYTSWRYAVACALMVAAALTVVFLKRWWFLVAFSLQYVSWILGWHAALERQWPCWWASNAEWCGHLCDSDPCECKEWRRGPAAYGGGTSCSGP